ncbi:hypothetical protein NVP2275O_248 [Vibrio phage 2.275.O._10N.286.54.E11]|nr:hypothetical protein NVP2275O_248 [Vibrio phage 2.275.O._10N.286.54.E11]
MSGIHAGIQTSHSLHEMFVKYQHAGSPKTKAAQDTLFDWARNHKTTIVLNGGMQENLEDLFYFLGMDANPYPFAKFHEADFSLNGALTNVGIVLPEAIYKTAAELRQFKSHGNTHRIKEHDDGSLHVFRDSKRNILLVTDDVTGENAHHEVYSPWQHELMRRMNRCNLMS